MNEWMNKLKKKVDYLGQKKKINIRKSLKKMQD